MTICQTAEMEIRQHFIPLYTQVDGILINDYKLSRLAYSLVILNADVSNPLVAYWQLKVMKNFLK